MPAHRRPFIVIAALAAPALCVAAPPPDAEMGKATFTAMCGMCHAVTESGGPTEGPKLLGVVGRRAGSEPDFPSYTAALKAYGVTWSTRTLDRFLVNPMAAVPGTAMPMLIPDDRTRANVVAYLATLKK